MQRSIAYFVARQGRVTGTVLFNLAYLHRKFLIAKLQPVIDEWQEVADPRVAPVMHFFARAFSRESPTDPDAVARLGHPWAQALYRALHCDRLREHDLVGDLRRLGDEGGYSLTHAAQATQMAIENGCLSGQKLEDVRTGQLKALADLVEPSLVSTDLGFEAMAMLFYLGARERVNPRWIVRTLDTQHADGGWGQTPDSTSDDHSTSLALWVLLEAAQPDAPRVSWMAGVR